MEQEQQIPSEDFNRAEQYLLGEMDADELKAFEQRMQQEPALQIMVDELRITIAGIRQAALKTRLDAYHSTMPATNGKPTVKSKAISLNRILAIAAMLIIAIGIGWWTLLRENKNEALYTKYYSKEPGLVTAMSSTDHYTFDRAMVDYKTGKYDAAITAWEGMLKQDESNDTLHYFIGSALLAKDEDAQAKPHLEIVAANANSYFMQDASWYLGLILIKEGKTADALPLIDKSSHPDKQALIEQLNKK